VRWGKVRGQRWHRAAVFDGGGWAPVAGDVLGGVL
jgi:hypothetical protein